MIRTNLMEKILVDWVNIMVIQLVISQNYAESFNDHTKLGKQLTAIYRKHYKSSKEEGLCQN